MSKIMGLAILAFVALLQTYDVMTAPMHDVGFEFEASGEEICSVYKDNPSIACMPPYNYYDF